MEHEKIPFIRELMRDFSEDEIAEAELRFLDVLAILYEHQDELVDLVDDN